MPAPHHSYNSRTPFRTLYRIMDLGVWEHGRLAALFFLKILPLLLLPLVISESIRAIETGMADPWHYLGWVYGVYLVVLVANIPLHIVFVRGCSRVIRGMELQLRASMVWRLQHLSMKFHGDSESGRFQTKVLRDVEEIVRFEEVYLYSGIGAAISIIFALVYTFCQDWRIAIAYVVVAPVAVGLVRSFRRVMGRRNEDLRREVETMSQRVSEMIEMTPITRAHGLEETEIGTMDQHLHAVRKRGHKVDEINAIFGACAFVVMMTSVVVIVGGTSHLVIRGALTLDKIALYSALFQMVVSSLNQLLNMQPQVAKSLASVRSIGEILECPGLEENEGRQPVEGIDGGIEFCNVKFSYPGSDRFPAVEDFSLKVKPGTCVAFVGESGSGKSTLMQLAIGFLRPDHGRILLDGIPMEHLDMRTWRHHIALVPQQTLLFSGTIRENITYGPEDYSEETISRAVEAANLRRVIDQLAHGLDTRAGEGGLKLSGGQRQRIAIARAIIRNPRFIILDEATSALDVVSEREVQTALENLIRGRTTFIVAHRLSTIRQADWIVVMSAGRIEEQGPPSKLEAASGAFARMKALQ